MHGEQSGGWSSLWRALSAAATLLAAGVATAAEPAAGKPDFQGELKRQESIYHARGDSTREGYTVDRSLEDYEDALATDFAKALAGLGSGDRWLDIGAGRAHAMLDYTSVDYDLRRPDGWARRNQKAKVVAMSIEDRRTPRWNQQADALGPEHISYLHGKRLGQYGPGELGAFRIVTDVIGGFSYTDDLSFFTERVLALLPVGGTFYTVLQDVQSEAGTNKPFYEKAPYLTEIERPDGSKVKVCDWLKRISCVAVTCELRARWRPPLEAYRVSKTCDAVRVPALERVHYEAGTPPERRFVMKN